MNELTDCIPEWISITTVLSQNKAYLDSEEPWDFRKMPSNRPWDKLKKQRIPNTKKKERKYELIKCGKEKELKNDAKRSRLKLMGKLLTENISLITLARVFNPCMRKTSIRMFSWKRPLFLTSRSQTNFVDERAETTIGLIDQKPKTRRKKINLILIDILWRHIFLLLQVWKEKRLKNDAQRSRLKLMENPSLKAFHYYFV